MPNSLTNGRFPGTRMRRIRKAQWSRTLVQENRLSTADLIWPLFIHEQVGSVDIASMPGVQRLSEQDLLRQCERALELGIPAIALFPNSADDCKDEMGSEAANPENLVCRSVQAIKQRFPELGVICDVALDPYTSHGQDGIVEDGYVVNEATVEMLVKQARVQAEAGADVVAPSDMMDGRVGSIRTALNDAGLIDTQVMSYAAKYASAFYGPFRDAVGSAPSASSRSGGKETYQIDPANSDEALREVGMDIQEGADSVIVKPGLPYLDIVWRVKEAFGVPTFAYQVSGEYAMLHAAAQNGWLDLEKVMMESLIAIKRAKADGIWTYFAPVAAEMIRASD